MKTDNGVADAAQECGYEQPKAVNVGELDKDEAEDLSIVRAQYNAADASYWAVYGSDYYYSKMSGAEKQLYQALYDVNMSFLTGNKSAGYKTFDSARHYHSGFVSIGSLDLDTALEVAKIVQMSNPQLSEKASKYYEQLKKKYSNMNFILVSEDQKENAKANAAGYANSNNMVVLIDEDKIERMASDENYRKQYEGIIANAASGISQLASSLSATGANVKGFGMQVNDNGTASYFAVLEKSSAAQKERIEKKAAEKKEAKKAAEKKAEKKKNQERLEKKRKETGDADLILYVIDGTGEFDEEERKIAEMVLSKKDQRQA